MKKKVTIVLFALVLVLALAACGGGGSGSDGGDVTTWKFAHSGTNDDVIDKYAQYFKKLVEEEFEGVEVALYPGEQLGNDDERFEAAQSGAAQFSMVASAFIGNVLPEAEAFGLSFIIPPDSETQNKAIGEGEAVKKINETVEGLGVKTMGWYIEGGACWTSNKPINTVDDMAGLKMRTMNTTIDIANVEGTGANAVPITYAEVYSALQLGTADGQGNAIDLIYSQKFYEVQDYMVLSYHQSGVNVIVANSDFYDSLSEEDQAKLDDIFVRVSEYVQEERDKNIQDAYDAIVEEGSTEIIEWSDEVRSEFIETSAHSQEVFLEMAGEPGKEILELLKADVENFSK